MNKETLYKISDSVSCSMEDFTSLISDKIPKDHFLLLFNTTPKKFSLKKLNLSQSYISTAIKKRSTKPHQNHQSHYQNFSRQGQKHHYYQKNHESFSLIYTSKAQEENIGKYYIEKLKEVCKELGIQLEKPFWYIKSFDEPPFGPLSSLDLTMMCNEHKINGDTLIRPLDIFKVKDDSNSLGFIKLKEINNDNFFTSKFEVNSDLVTLAEKFKDIVIKKEKEEKVTKEKKEKEEEILKEKIRIEEEKRRGIEVGKDNEKEKSNCENNEKSIENIDENLEGNESRKNEELVEEIVTDIPSKEDVKEEIKIKGTENTNSNEPRKIIKAIGKNKRKKGKMIDLEGVKTGFYTMSYQEKNFSQMYICGTTDEIENVPNHN